ncbi:MAG TPA: protein kinase [Gemmatimonadales bacterium]|nr:protein kinase [Gemmatimonadales bacterium]
MIDFTAMFRWFKRSSSPAERSAESDPEAIRQYRVVRKLGEGGMGIVYEARDERLGRLVAIKRVRGLDSDASLKQRLWREARVAAGISHPNICQVYELAEEGGELFVVMELLTGETLAERIERGALPLGEALQITLGILGALEAMHSRAIIHRDLKPTNIYLTPHGVKLLDFGLARPDSVDQPLTLTRPGAVVGTPRYMAPEMFNDAPLSPGTDLFAVGAIMFEMVTAKPAFGGRTVFEVYTALMKEQPPPLVGGADVMAADGIIQRALAKQPSDRYPAASAMAREVREAVGLLDGGRTGRVQTMTRLIVLPFKLLRPDAEIEFLGSSLPEAITESLSGLEMLTVRSTAAATRFAAESLDLKTIASEAGVDVVLLGTLLRDAGQVRVSIQLVEAPGGTVVISRSAQVPLTDIFQLQDELTRQIVDALAIPLSARDRGALHRDVPVSPDAYQLYLHATHIAEGSASPSRLVTARDLYRRCVELDPKYAPAWARLGRVHRVLGKYGHGDVSEERRRAEEAFRTALELNPDLPLAHNLYTYFEIEEFGAAPQAVLRLLRQVESGAADPDLYAGLVVACRFCGLLEASLAADRRARRIDPGVRTSVHYTYWTLGDYEQTTLSDLEEIQALRYAALWMMGKKEEALTGVRLLESRWPTSERWYLQALRGAFENDRAECVEGTRKMLETGFHDPEGLLFCARNLARVQDRDFALEMLGRVVNGGFYCSRLLVQDPWFDSVRAEPEFIRVLHLAEAKSREAAAAFSRAGGERLLGVAN